MSRDGLLSSVSNAKLDDIIHNADTHVGSGDAWSELADCLPPCVAISEDKAVALYPLTGISESICKPPSRSACVDWYSTRAHIVAFLCPSFVDDTDGFKSRLLRVLRFYLGVAYTGEFPSEHEVGPFPEYTKPLIRAYVLCVLCAAMRRKCHTQFQRRHQISELLERFVDECARIQDRTTSDGGRGGSDVTFLTEIFDDECFCLNLAEYPNGIYVWLLDRLLLRGLLGIAVGILESRSLRIPTHESAAESLLEHMSSTAPVSIDKKTADALSLFKRLGEASNTSAGSRARQISNGMSWLIETLGSSGYSGVRGMTVGDLSNAGSETCRLLRRTVLVALLDSNQSTQSIIKHLGPWMNIRISDLQQAATHVIRSKIACESLLGYTPSPRLVSLMWMNSETLNKIEKYGLIVSSADMVSLERSVSDAFDCLLQVIFQLVDMCRLGSVVSASSLVEDVLELTQNDERYREIRGRLAFVREALELAAWISREYAAIDLSVNGLSGFEKIMYLSRPQVASCLWDMDPAPLRRAKPGIVTRLFGSEVVDSIRSASSSFTTRDTRGRSRDNSSATFDSSIDTNRIDPTKIKPSRLKPSSVESIHRPLSFAKNPAMSIPKWVTLFGIEPTELQLSSVEKLTTAVGDYSLFNSSFLDALCQFRSEFEKSTPLGVVVQTAEELGIA